MVKTDQQRRAAMSWFIIEFEDRLKNHLVKMVITQNYLQGRWLKKTVINPL